jgi:Flp pilus assembly protein TadD
MAIVNHRQVLELNPDDASSYYHLGLALRDRGRIKEAITNLKQALTLYQQQNQLEAVETIKSILQNLTPSNPL